GGYAPPQLEMHRSFVLRFQLARRIDQYGSLGKGRGVARLRSHSGCRVVIGLFRGDGNRIAGREGFLQPFIQGLLFLLWGLLAPWVRRSSSARAVDIRLLGTDGNGIARGKCFFQAAIQCFFAAGGIIFRSRKGGWGLVAGFCRIGVVHGSAPYSVWCSGGRRTTASPFVDAYFATSTFGKAFN